MIEPKHAMARAAICVIIAGALLALQTVARAANWPSWIRVVTKILISAVVVVGGYYVIQVIL